MPKTITLQIRTRLQDNGDGGYTLYWYNNDEEMLADHPKNRRGDMTEKEHNEILTEDDPYENGYLGWDSIEIIVYDNGAAALAKNIHFHAGQ